MAVLYFAMEKYLNRVTVEFFFVAPVAALAKSGFFKAFLSLKLHVLYFILFVFETM